MHLVMSLRRTAAEGLSRNSDKQPHTASRLVLGLALACAAVLSGCGDAAKEPVAAPVPVVAAPATASRPQGSGDYFDAQVQAKAAQLIAEVNGAATTAATLKKRAQVLWVWANASAMAGDELDPDLPMAIARIASLPDPVPGGTPEVTALSTRVDAWVRLLAVRKANPKALGRLGSPNTGPFPVDSFQTLDLVYTVGDAPIETGGGFLVAVKSAGHPLLFQATDAAGEGYTTVVPSNPEVKIALESRPVEGVFGAEGPLRSSASALQRPFFRIVDGRLRPGDTVNIRVGEIAKGGTGLHLPSISTSALRLRVWVQLGANTGLHALPEIPFSTEGQGTSGVRGFAPSLVAVGENVRIAVRSEDAFRNRASSDFPAYSVQANGLEIGRVSNTNVALNTVNTAFQTAGVYYISIVSTDGKVKGEANPILVQPAVARRLLWGDINGHSGMGDGQGTVDAWFTFARDDARLDFAALSDADVWLDDAEWESTRQAVLKYRRPAEFETFLANEWTAAPGAGGQRIVLFRNPDDSRRADRQRAPQLDQLYALLAAEHAVRDVVTVALAHEPADWWRSDGRFDQYVQVVSNRGAFEWLGRRYLQAGFQMGALGGSADQVGHPGLRALDVSVAGDDNQGGLAAVYAANRTRDGIFDALKAGTAYATNGARILLEMNVNGAQMGTRIANTPNRVLSGQAIAAAPIDRVVILKNGDVVQAQDFARATSAAGARAIEVRFSSDSDPQARSVAARGFRVWRGTLTLSGAKLLDVRSPGNDNWYTEKVLVSSTNPQLVEFTVRTRGNERAIALMLEGVSAATRVDLNVTSQMSAGPAAGQGAGPTDAVRQTLTAGSLVGGEQVIRRSFGNAVDTISVRLLGPPTERQRSFRYLDTTGQDGDAYAVRVTTSDGGTAWSSPVWVGGRAGQPLKLAGPPAAATVGTQAPAAAANAVTR